MEKGVVNLDQFNIKICVNKLKDLRIERLSLDDQLDKLIIEYNMLKIKNKL